MPVRLGWGDEAQTFLYCQFIGNWTWEDYYEIIDYGRKLTRDSDLKYIPTIVNLSDSRDIPPNPLSHLRRVIQNPYPKQGRILLVDAPLFLKTLLPAVHSLIKNRNQNILLVDTMPEALELIKGYQIPG